MQLQLCVYLVLLFESEYEFYCYSASVIVHIISRLNVGGTSVWIRNLVSECEKRGEQSIVISGNVAFEIPDSIYYENYVKTLKYWGKKSRISQNIRAFFEIRRLLKDIKPAVVNTHTAKAGLLGRLAVISLGRHRPLLIHTIHGHYLYGYKKPTLSALWLINEAFLAIFTNKIICVGSKVKEEIERTRLFSSTKLLIVFPGISITTEEINPKGDSRYSHHRSFIVGWMGRLEQVKKPECLIRIAEMLPHIQFIMVGHGSLQNKLLDRIPPNLKHLRHCQPSELWPYVDLALSTSENEGIPTALIEATLYGIPSVAPDVGSISDVVEDGINGILVSKSSEELLANAISFVATNKNLYHTLELGCENIAKRFSVEMFYKAHSIAYRKSE